MIDLYVKSTDKTQLTNFCTFFTHVIGPVKGTAGWVYDDGKEFPARGNPEYWYACIRGPVQVIPEAPIEVCEYEEGSEVCGVWA